MEKKFGAFFANAGNAAKEAADKAKEAADRAKEATAKAREKVNLTLDQNGDGKLDISDLTAVSDAVGEAARKSAMSVKEKTAELKESAEESRKRLALKKLQPLFPNALAEADFSMPKLIRVADRDKKHAESDVCQGSIGFTSDKGGMRVITIFKDSLVNFGLTFYPDAEDEFYYVNPINSESYIALNDYFNYLKVARVNELQRVARDLGAKHFKVTYREENMSFDDIKGKTKVKASSTGGEAEYAMKESKNSAVSVAAEMYMDGHPPRQPELVYLKKDESVQNLIHLRMTGGDGFHNHRISIKLSNSTGIKESEAVKIDTAVSDTKVSASANIAKEARNESNRYLEYEIEF